MSKIRRNPAKSGKTHLYRKSTDPPKNKEDACIYIPSPSPFDVIRRGFLTDGEDCEWLWGLWEFWIHSG